RKGDSSIHIRLSRWVPTYPLPSEQLKAPVYSFSCRYPGAVRLRRRSSKEPQEPLQCLRFDDVSALLSRRPPNSSAVRPPPAAPWLLDRRGDGRASSCPLPGERCSSRGDPPVRSRRGRPPWT